MLAQVVRCPTRLAGPGYIRTFRNPHEGVVLESRVLIALLNTTSVAETAELSILRGKELHTGDANSAVVEFTEATGAPKWPRSSRYCGLLMD